MAMRFDSERNNTRGQDGLSWQVTLQATFGSLSSIMNLFWFSERFFFYWNFIIFKAYLQNEVTGLL